MSTAAFTAWLKERPSPQTVADRQAVALIERHYARVRHALIPCGGLILAMFVPLTSALVWCVLVGATEFFQWQVGRRMAQGEGQFVRPYLIGSVGAAAMWAVGSALLWVSDAEAVNTMALAGLLANNAYATTFFNRDRNLMIANLIPPQIALLFLPAVTYAGDRMLDAVILTAYSAAICVVVGFAAVRVYRGNLDLRLTKERAQATAERLHFAMQSISSAVWEIDLVNARLVDAETLTPICGRAPTYEEIGSPNSPFTHPEDQPQVNVMVQRMLSQAGPATSEHRIWTVTGEEHWVRMSGIARRDASGALTSLILLTEDITARKNNELDLLHAQLDLQESAARLALALDVSKSAAFEVDYTGKRLIGHEALMDLFGVHVTYEMCTSRAGMMDLIDPRNRDSAREASLYDLKNQAKSEHLTLRLNRPNSPDKWITISATHHYDGDGARTRTIHFVTNVTDAKQRELALVAAREDRENAMRRLELAMEHADAAVWEVQMPGLRLEGGEALTRLLGIDVNAETFAADPWLMCHPDDRDMVQTELFDALNATGAANVESRFLRPDGSIGWLHTTGRATTNAEGQRTGYIMMTRDITLSKSRAIAFRDLLRAAEPGMNARRPVLEAIAQDIGADRMALAAGPDNVTEAFNDWIDEAFARFAKITAEIEAREHALFGAVVALKEARAESERLALIASQGTDAVMITDHYVRIEWVNAAFEKISGYRTEEVIGLKPGHFLQGPGTGTDPDAADVIRRAMKARTPVSVELLNYTKDGQPYWLDISMTPVFDKTGELERFIAVERDVTARRQMAEDLSRAPQEARTAREAAEHANAEKSRFLANMSHELRTPLNAVIGYAEILEEELNESGEEACARDAQRIKAGRHLLHLINDLLDLSKIEAGKVELTLGPVDISTLAQEAIDTIGPVASANGNELEVSIDDAVGTAFTDGPKVRQCVLNLLSNAAKFTKNGAVRLHVQREQQAGGDRIVFVVSDSGIGIAPGRIARLFAPFAQADSSIQKRFGGTGLGLAITRSLAQALGGDISVTSVQGQGPTFTLHVAATCEDRIEDVLLEADGDAPVVLVIEDEPCARDLVRRAVARVGFVARGAETGASGLGLAAQIKPAAIVLDIALPDMSGWEVLERLKGDLATRDVPVIVSSVVDGAEEAQRRGAAIFLAKPNERDALVAAILRVARPGEQASLGATLMMEYALDVEVA